jgi:hypothetical protein
MKAQIIQRAFDHLKPGGWLECHEIPAMIGCDDGSMPDNYGWVRWVRDFEVAARLANRQLDIGPHLRDWMREVGFVDVQETVFKIPINGWPKETELKHVGMMWQRNLHEGVSGFSLGMFNRFLKKTVEEIEVSSFFAALCGRFQPLTPLPALPGGRPAEPVRQKRPRLPQAVRRLGTKARNRLALANDRPSPRNRLLPPFFHKPPQLRRPFPPAEPLQLCPLQKLMIEELSPPHHRLGYQHPLATRRPFLPVLV